MLKYYNPHAHQIEEGPIADFANRAMLNHPRTARLIGVVGNTLGNAYGLQKDMIGDYAKHAVPDDHVKATPLPKPIHKAVQTAKNVAKPVTDKYAAFKQTSHGKVAHALGSAFGSKLVAKGITGAFKAATN